MKCGENLNSLTAMKLSPYYKVFEEEASAWEDRLNRIHVLFDVWIDVQRQWVYLEFVYSSLSEQSLRTDFLLTRSLPTEVFSLEVPTSSTSFRSNLNGSTTSTRNFWQS